MNFDDKRWQMNTTTTKIKTKLPIVAPNSFFFILPYSRCDLCGVHKYNSHEQNVN